jgi:RNA polymerase-binding transcription factor DksA
MSTIVRYSDEELLEFKNLIDSKLSTAREELEFMRDQILELNENSGDQQGGDWFDDSSIHQELEMLNGMVIRQQQFVRNLENALIRIQNKTYGVCSVTGQLIDKKRLMLVPHATKSMEAKEEKANAAPVVTVIDKRDDDGESKRMPEAKGPRIIDRVIRKTSTKAAGKSKVEEEDDDFEWDLLGEDIAVDAIDDDYEDEEDDYEGGSSIIKMNNNDDDDMD